MIGVTPTSTSRKKIAGNNKYAFNIHDRKSGQGLARKFGVETTIHFVQWKCGACYSWFDPEDLSDLDKSAHCGDVHLNSTGERRTPLSIATPYSAKA